MADGISTIYVGVDWADTEHRVIVLSAAREPLHAWGVPHTGAALTAFAARLTELTDGDPRRVAVALEVPRGPLVSAAVTSSRSTRNPIGALPGSLQRGRRQRRSARCPRAG